MFAKQTDYVSPSQYLAMEEQAETRSEYHQGRVVAMAGASIPHNRIVSNLSFALANAIGDNPCEVFSQDLRVWLKRDNRYVYPDIIVVCGELELVEGRDDMITNPKVIIEVLSESTEQIDRSEKFRAYWTLDSFQEYVLVDQYKMRVEYFKRVDETVWELRVLTKPEQILVLPSLGVEIPLSQIYRRVTFIAPEL